MDRSVSTTMRARKVIYDDYTNAFYVETRVEALERQVATRAKLTDVLNRSHETRLRNQKKQVEAEKDIFEKKNERELSFHKEQLKDHVAHKQVLNDIAHRKSADAHYGGRDSHLGTYGLGCSKMEIQPLIDQRLKENTPSAKRQRDAKRIQSKRRGIKVFDRTKTTSALLRLKPQIKSRPDSEAAATEDSTPTASKQLILPPITVRWARHRASPGETISGTRVNGSDDNGGYGSRRPGDSTNNNKSLPTFFVTQGRF